MFHRIVARPEQDHDVAWPTFAALVKEFEQNSVLPSADLGPIGPSGPGRPSEEAPRPVVLTFDDGTLGHLRVAEELASRQMQAVFFVSAGELGKPGFLLESDVLAIAALGHVIGSHGMRHRRLDRMSRSDAFKELADSKHALENIVGSPVSYFAAVGGCTIPRIDEMLIETGYVAARSVEWGFYGSPAQRWAIPCVPVTEFTVRRGWVIQSVQRRSLPASMQLVRYARRLVHRNMRSTFRAYLRFLSGSS